MKEQILALYNQGKTYNEISKILNCSKGTISYHCGNGQKEKSLLKQRQRRNQQHYLSKKVEQFSNRKLYFKTASFQKNKKTFTVEDVISKFGIETKCYLTGCKINLINDTNYEFDHIIPASKGGLNTLDNLGITLKVANRVKHNCTVEELVNICKLIIKNVESKEIESFQSPCKSNSPNLGT